MTEAFCFSELPLIPFQSLFHLLEELRTTALLLFPNLSLCLRNIFCSLLYYHSLYDVTEVLSLAIDKFPK